MTCLKLDVVKLVEHLGSAESYQILPGVSIVYSKSKRNDTSLIPADLAVSLVRDANSTEKLDRFLFQKVDNFLSSLSLNVKLLDSRVIGSVRKFSVSAFSSFFPSFWPEEGRKKKDSYHAAAMWSAGTLAAVGFSALAAMSGKALMTSMIALLLAAMSAFKHHGGGKTSHYEIITKPAHYHDHDHLHSASYTGAPYSYARHLVIAPAEDDRNGPPDEYKIPFRPYPLSPTYIPAHDK
nr:PREDICTED: uncharacterized protein LOC109038943 [Bemisia tabaci]